MDYIYVFFSAYILKKIEKKNYWIYSIYKNKPIIINYL